MRKSRNYSDSRTGNNKITDPGIILKAELEFPELVKKMTLIIAVGKK